jgi:hypothetical protein
MPDVVMHRLRRTVRPGRRGIKRDRARGRLNETRANISSRVMNLRAAALQHRRRRTISKRHSRRIRIHTHRQTRRGRLIPNVVLDRARVGVGAGRAMRERAAQRCSVCASSRAAVGEIRVAVGCEGDRHRVLPPIVTAPIRVRRRSRIRTHRRRSRRRPVDLHRV